MNAKLYRLLLVDSDRIFRMGLRSWLAQFPDLEIVAEADYAEDALVILRVDSEDDSSAALEIDLVIVDLNLSAINSEIDKSNCRLGLELCQQLKIKYPDLPILLLSAPQAPKLLAMALSYGVEGYCLKGTSPEELITAIRQVVIGEPYLGDRNFDGQDLGDRDISIPNSANQLIPNLPNQPLSVTAIVRHHFYLSGIRHIDQILKEVKASLDSPTKEELGDRLAKMVLAGQERELQSARWLLRQLWGPRKGSPVITQSIPITNVEDVVTVNGEIGDRLTNNHNSDILAIQASLWDITVTKLQSSLTNLSKTPLEIDILKDEKKRELLYIALRQVECSLTELRFAEIQPSQLGEKIPAILENIWQETVVNFFGKYYILSSPNYKLDYKSGNKLDDKLNNNLNVNDVNIVDVLLKDFPIIQSEFLNQIPQIDNLFSHLLFKTDLVMNNAIATLGSPEAMRRAELILDNLIIQIANAAIQPLLNNFADVEEIKHKFYRYNLLASREIERFRNDLSWKYRLKKYVADPQLIFESRHILFALTNPNIRKISIYAPRTQELEQLEGVQLAVTLVLELKDAISPRLKSAIGLLGNGFVYILTNVIGRGIGLIGRGVVQGIGNAWQDRNSKN
ncbi:MAG: DUF3685 domain-containing protein [Pseudanabaena sp. ELA645]|jgi:DNA-binding NarL/FixJ family response regulator